MIEKNKKRYDDSLGGGLALCAANLRLLAALLLDLLQGGTNDRAVDLRGLTRAVWNQGQHRIDQTADKARGGEGGWGRVNRAKRLRMEAWGGVEIHQPGSLNNRTYLVLFI